MFLLVLCALFVGLLTIWKYFNDENYADFYKLKGPKPLPFLGNTLLFGSTPREIFETQLKLIEKYGDYFRLNLGMKKIIVTAKPEHLELILGNTKHIKKSSNYDFFINWLGNGLINSSGDYWKKHRKIITPTFHFKSLQYYSMYMEKNLKVLVKLMEGKSGQIINILEYIKLYALDTLCDSAMRYELNCQSDASASYVKAMNGYLEIHIRRFFSSFYRISFIFNNSKLAKEQQKHVTCMNTFTNQVINSRKAERAALQKSDSAAQRNEFDERPQRSFLDLLIDKQDEEDILSDVEIREEVNTFMFAGHDTVSSSISFCLYELCQHPKLQDELVEESYNVMPQGKEIEVNCSNIGALKLLENVVKESMRIYTTVPFVERELGEDVVLDDLRIPAGTTVQIMMYSLHRNEKYYPEPEKFDPDRFSTENTRNRHPYAYIPFSAGPRNCIGYKYGLLMTKASVINILRNFKVSRPTDAKYTAKLYNSAILGSENGINLIFDKRN